MNVRIACALAVLAVAPFVVTAQERVALQPVNTTSDITNPALVRKIAHQQQVISVLQSQLNACRNGEDITGTIPEPEEEFHALNTQPDGDEADSMISAATTPARTTTYNTAPAGSRRTTGVYQQAAEPKLTCADYSMYYFSRHPSMAAVCGVNTRVMQTVVTATVPVVVAPVLTEQPAAEASPTTPRRTVSATTPNRLPSRP